MPNFPTHLAYSEFESPVGTLLLAGNDRGLCLVSFPIDRYRRLSQDGWRRDDAALAEPRRQLEAYFDGALTDFDLQLQFLGSAFQNTVWHALRTVPFGETTSYGAIASRIGRPAASRAVGAANGANPLPIIVPCHRIVGASGALTGFGGGLQTKTYLLAHESAVAGQTRSRVSPSARASAGSRS